VLGRARSFLRRRRLDLPARTADTPPLLGLRFEQRARFRPFALVAPQFAQLDVRPPDGRVEGVVRTEHTPVAPFAAVELEVRGAQSGTIVAGLVAGARDYVLATYDPARREASIEVAVAGSTTVAQRTRVAVSTGFGFAFVLCDNQVTALLDTGTGWQPLLTSRREVAALVDFRDPGILSRHAYAYGGRGGQANIARVSAGSFGMVGLRDPHLVQLPDGSPYSPDGRLYLTFTCAGLGGFQQAHWGVFAFDPTNPSRVEHVAQLFFRRDGRLLGDHAGQLVWEPDGQRFLVMVSSWGDFTGDGVHIRHLASGADLLSGVHVLDSEPLALPTPMSAWDPALALVDRRWHLAFVESPSQRPFTFHPALAAAEPGAAYDGSLRMVGGDPSRTQCEGTLLSRFGGQWLLLASDEHAKRYLAYDLDMALLGALDAPYGTNIPHPQLVPDDSGGYLMVTFDGTQYAEPVLGYGTHGDVVVLKSQPA
jgi:hypothetical protein